MRRLVVCEQHQPEVERGQDDDHQGDAGREGEGADGRRLEGVDAEKVECQLVQRPRLGVLVLDDLQVEPLLDAPFEEGQKDEGGRHRLRVPEEEGRGPVQRHQPPLFDHGVPGGGDLTVDLKIS